MTSRRARLARSVLRHFPVHMVEQLSNFLPRCQANRLLRLTVQDRDLIISNGQAGGLRFNVGRSNWRAAFGRYEIPMQRAIAENVGDGEVFYDIGANAGFFSVLAARHVGRSGRVVAFEPEPGNAALLRHNLEINALAHVTVIEKAVSSQPGQAKLLLDANPVKSALAQFRTTDDVTGEMAIEVVQIDQLVENQQLPPPALVKIDVEGADYAVMQGMTRTLDQFRPTIIYEVDDEREEAARIRERQIERFLSERGYKIHRLEDAYPDIPHYVAHFLAQPLALLRSSSRLSHFAWMASAIAA